MKLFLPKSIRSKKNSKRIYARGKFKQVLPSKAYVEWEREARIFVIKQIGYNFKLLEEELSINAQIYYKGQRPDLSGCFESIGDCLESIVYKNDRQIVSWDGSRLWHNLEDPHTIVEINIIGANNG